MMAKKMLGKEKRIQERIESVEKRTEYKRRRGDII